MSYTYSARTLIDRAMGLADLKNSAFLSWGEHFHYMNTAYREVYQDIISINDTAYLKQVTLLSDGEATFDLPDDFYQLAALTDGAGNSLPRKRMEAPDNAYGYTIRNNQLHVAGSGSPLTLMYYPSPDTISFKAPDINISLPASPVSGFGDNVLLSDGRIYNIRTSTFTKSTTSALTGTSRLGSYTYVTGNAEYTFGGSKIGDGPFLLLSDGSFSQVHDAIDYGAANYDLTAIFYVNDSGLYYSRYDGEGYEVTKILDEYNGGDFRYIYWNNKDAIINSSMIIYCDGTTETTDVFGQKVVLVKTDEETGYGYIALKGASYVLTGFTPDTRIDFPSNVLFDLAAYKLAIQYRIKQNADSSALQGAYLELRKTYVASLSQDGSSYSTIRNVHGRITRWFYGA